ncbi:MAG: hypothetical protein KDA24_26280, partial [Deltaproteobacteria bacterium]|nr:hypothetical protein [Deltaproteobacteria bacterium]
ISAPADRPDPPGTDLCDGSKWRKFVHSLGSEDSLGVARGMLARSGFMGCDDKRITVGFYSAVTLEKVVPELDDEGVIASLADWFGAATTLDLVLDTEGVSGRSLAEEIDRIKAEKTAILRREALNSPAVTVTQEVFPGASVIGEPRIPAIQEIADVH